MDWNNPKDLAKAIKERGLTVGGFSGVAGVSRAQLFRLMRGSPPRWDTQRKVEDALQRIPVLDRAA
jgi:predicted transcriptional regulator